MALGGAYWFADEWEPGLALAPHLAILPHHNLVRMRLTPDRLLADLPDGVTLIGIDETTTVICHPDGTYQVEGTGEVMVYRSIEQLDEYPSEQRFTLDRAGRRIKNAGGTRPPALRYIPYSDRPYTTMFTMPRCADVDHLARRLALHVALCAVGVQGQPLGVVLAISAGTWMRSRTLPLTCTTSVISSSAAISGSYSGHACW